MLEFSAIFPPFDESFIDLLHELGTTIFGEIDREDYFAFHMINMPDVSVQIARDDGLVGFKIGYALNTKRYQSALGGVHPEHRRKGIARRLMQEQHDWARKNGYGSIETGAVNSNDGMIALNIRVGFQVFGTYCRSDEPRVMMRKVL